MLFGVPVMLRRSGREIYIYIYMMMPDWQHTGELLCRIVLQQSSQQSLSKIVKRVTNRELVDRDRDKDA